MAQLFRTLVITLVVVGSGASATADAVPDAVREGRGMRFGVTDPEGGWSVITLLPADHDSGVTLEYAVAPCRTCPTDGKITRNYSADMLRSLRRTWGSARFDLSAWKSDICLDSDMVWFAEAGGRKVHLCHNRKAIDRLARLQSTIQVVMKSD